MISHNNIKHILVSRTDNIGDVVLTLPLLGILKKQYPQVKISFLARDYVHELIKNCVHVDEFVSWDALSHMSNPDAITFLKSKKIDAVIHVFPKKEIAVLMKLA